jgi:hypothetical protein
MRELLLQGQLHYPGQAILNDYPEQEENILNFWNTIWYNYLNDNDTNGIYWYEKLGIKLYNDMVRRLSAHKWITSNSLIGRKWASVELNTDKLLEFVSPDELETIKTEFKYSKYVLECNASTKSKIVRQNGKTRKTGLVRKGFRDAGNTQFGYDMRTLNKYEDAIKLNLTKSMDKIRHMYPEMKTSGSSYDAVSIGIYDWHDNNQMETFTTGDSISDSRGRAISQCLGKVFNPISSKDARASLVITYK